MKLVQSTTGPILELGCGWFSTPYLHWACFPTRRKLVTCENLPAYYDFAKLGEADFHEVQCIQDWDTVDLSRPWGIAFVDNDPEEYRKILIGRLHHADYVIVHDTQRTRNGFREVARTFRYHYKYRDTMPATSVLSDVHDLSGFAIP